jgi:hypothetical protein
VRDVFYDGIVVAEGNEAGLAWEKMELRNAPSSQERTLRRFRAGPNKSPSYRGQSGARQKGRVREEREADSKVRKFGMCALLLELELGVLKE